MALFDLFNRGGGESTPFALENHTPDGGGTWVNRSVASTRLVLTADGAVRASGNDTVWYALTGGTAPLTSQDYDVKVRFKRLSGSGYNFGVALRMNPAAVIGTAQDAGYIWAFIADQGQALVLRQLGGAAGAAASGNTVTLGLATGEEAEWWFKIRTTSSAVNMSVHIGSRDAVAFFALSDTAGTRILSGSPGLYMYAANSNDDASGIQVLEYEAYDAITTTPDPDPSPAGTLYMDSPTLLASPENWVSAGTGATAKKGTVNPGAYLQTMVSTLTQLTINCDMTASAGMASGDKAMIGVLFDGGNWQYYPAATSVTVTVPPSRSEARSLIIGLAAVYGAVERWTPASGQFAPPASLVITSLSCNTSATFAAPAAKPNKLGVFWDSIGEGVNNVSLTLANNVNSNAFLSWVWLLRTACNAEVGAFCFGGQGWVNTGNSGTLPNLQATYGFKWAGQARSFTGFTALLFGHGTNDSNDTAVRAAINAVNTGIKATAAITPMLFFKNPNNAVSTGITGGATDVGATATLVPGLVGVLGAGDTLDSVHPTAAADRDKMLPVIATATNRVLLGISGGGTTPTPTGLTKQDVRDALALALSSGVVPAAGSVDLVLLQTQTTINA